MQHNDDRQRGTRRSGRMVAAMVVAIAAIFLLLHLAGVFGPGAH